MESKVNPQKMLPLSLERIDEGVAYFTTAGTIATIIAGGTLPAITLMLRCRDGQRPETRSRVILAFPDKDNVRVYLNGLNPDSLVANYGERTYFPAPPEYTFDYVFSPATVEIHVGKERREEVRHEDVIALYKIRTSVENFSGVVVRYNRIRDERQKSFEWMDIHSFCLYQEKDFEGKWLKNRNTVLLGEFYPSVDNGDIIWRSKGSKMARLIR